jgi:hypothetical protein
MVSLLSSGGAVTTEELSVALAMGVLGGDLLEGDPCFSLLRDDFDLDELPSSSWNIKFLSQIPEMLELYK